MSNDTKLVASAADNLAPDLVALFLGAQPHPDIVIPQPTVTVADLFAAAREGGTQVSLKWDGPRQRLTA